MQQTTLDIMKLKDKIKFQYTVNTQIGPRLTRLRLLDAGRPTDNPILHHLLPQKKNINIS